MRLVLLIGLLLVGALLVTAGVAMIYPPAGLILAGAACVALAFFVEVRDT